MKPIKLSFNKLPNFIFLILLLVNFNNPLIIFILKYTFLNINIFLYTFIFC